MTSTPALEAIREFATQHGLEYETVDNRTLVVVVPGEHRLRTSVSFCCQDTAVSINAFVIRHPDENEANEIGRAHV